MALFTPCYRHRNSTRAFTLTEIAIVLGIIGLVLGGIWAAASMTSLSSQMKTAQDQTAFILSGYRTLYSAKGVDVAAIADVTCTGVTNDYFPRSMVVGACTTGTTASYPLNPWNGYVQVFADPVNQGLQIGYYNISEAACNRYAAMMGSAQDVIIETVNGNSTGLLPPLGANVPYTMAQVAGFCVPGNGNVVTLTFAAR